MEAEGGNLRGEDNETGLQRPVVGILDVTASEQDPRAHDPGGNELPNDRRNPGGNDDEQTNTSKMTIDQKLTIQHHDDIQQDRHALQRSRWRG